jgi:hypothetical protein
MAVKFFLSTVSDEFRAYRGIPWLQSIRRNLGDRVHFWSFDGWDIPAGRSAIAEVYPSLWRRDFAPEGRTVDRHDALCIATGSHAPIATALSRAP